MGAKTNTPPATTAAAALSHHAALLRLRCRTMRSNVAVSSSTSQASRS
ncbi:MAG: hypothetical protein IJ841_07995 [Prevotella sp.]|nr:hypothetical protein [Prevotella sp.]